MVHLFISFRHEDAEFAQNVVRDLCRIRDSVWIDSQPDFVDEDFEAALRQCPSLFVVVTPNREFTDPEFEERLDQWLSFLIARGVPCILSDDPLPDDRTYLSLLRVLQTDFDPLTLRPSYHSPPHSIYAEEPLSESPDEYLCPPADERPGLGRTSLNRYRQALLEHQDATTERQVTLIGHWIRSCRSALRLSRAELAGQLEVEVEVLVTIENGCGDVETAFWLLESVQQLRSDMLDSSGDGLVTGLH
jgi:DNA-binding XRE family transcriptional regulator